MKPQTAHKVVTEGLDTSLSMQGGFMDGALLVPSALVWLALLAITSPSQYTGHCSTGVAYVIVT